jgi:hypothetical protein
MRTKLVTLIISALTASATASAAPSEPWGLDPSPTERAAIADFGRCVASESPAKVRSVLTSDFRTKEYRDGMKVLAKVNETCFKGRGRMRAGGLPFAAAMAEAMIHKGEGALNVRLAKAGMGKAAPTYAPSDAVAMCVARSVPDQAAALLTAPIASEAETRAANDLSTAVRLCTPQGVSIDIAPFGLRSILATASYRLLAAQES